MITDRKQGFALRSGESRRLERLESGEIIKLAAERIKFCK
jgi:hypothetical protein